MMISIIIPVYNAERFLDETVHSIISQTDDNFELILVDDGSKDNSWNIIQKYVKEYDCIKGYQQKNAGAPAARNNGFSNSKGEYIWYFDADDLMYPNAIRDFHQAINKMPELELVIGDYSIVSEGGALLKDSSIQKKNILMKNADKLVKFMQQNPFPGNKIYKRSVIENHNLKFDNLKIAQDTNFYLKFLSVCKNAYIMDGKAFKYRIVGNSISHTANLHIVEVDKCIESARQFAVAHGASEVFLNEMPNRAINNYYHQFVKYKLFKKPSEQKYVFHYFYEKMHEVIKSSSENVSERDYEMWKKVKRTYHMRLLYLNPLYIKLYQTMKQMKNKRSF